MLALIAEHRAKVEQAIAQGDEQPISHLTTELRTFTDQLAILEQELIARGIER